MKLMFLVEHFNPKRGILAERPRLGNQFLIYYYGVFSFEVMEAFEELVRERKNQRVIPFGSKREG
nr:hypothetical protein [Candidatus Freyrarchaeum guaymaensis]